MAGNLPYFPLFPSDWVLETKFLTLHEQGALLQLVCAMHESQVRGYLLFNGGPMPPDRIARILGIDRQPALDVLDRLLESCVLKRDDAGVVFYPPMVKREELRKTRSKVGRSGGKATQSKLGRLVAPSLLEQNAKQIPKHTPSKTLECGNGIGSSSSEGECRGGTEAPVELPIGWPKTADEAVRMKPVSSKATDDQVRVFWGQAASRGGRDIGGNILPNFWVYVDSRVETERARQHERNSQNALIGTSGRQKSPNDIRLIVEAKDRIVKELERRYANEAPTGELVWSDPQKRSMWQAEKKAIKDLNAQLAGGFGK